MEKVEYNRLYLIKIATQTFVSSHVVDNIVRMIAHASIKPMTKNWWIKTRGGLLHVRPNNSHDFRS